MMSRLRLIAPVAVALLVAFPSIQAAPAPKAPAPRSATGTLANDRQKLSYAIGMKLGTGLDGVITSLKDDVDRPTLLKALNTMVAHGTTELTIPEAQAQLQPFSQLMQARQAALQAKKPLPVHTATPAEKHKLSYALGMKFGNDLNGMIDANKADADADVVLRGFNTTIAHGTPELPQQQAQILLQAFDKKIQARQQAEQARQQAEQVKMQAQAQAAGQKNLAAGNAFLAANAKKPGVKTTATGLQYMVETQGTGAKPKATDTVRVNYRGTLLDGTEFDSSAKHGGPAEFGVGQVVAGWTEALQMMGVGSKYVLWLPAKLGYGAEAGAPGGPNSVLKFEVELLSIKK